MTGLARAVCFDLGARDVATLDPVDVRLDGRVDQVFWIHLDGSDPQQEQQVFDALGVPQDLREEWNDPSALPGMIERDDSITLRLRWWSPSSGADGDDPVHLYLHMTERYCLTLARAPVPCIEEFARTCRRDFEFAKSVGFILFLILDALVDDMAHQLPGLHDESESIDEAIFEHFEPGLNARILSLKRRVLKQKRIAIVTRDVLMRLSGRRIRVVSELCRLSLGNVYDHAQVLVTSLDSIRDMISSTQDGYMSLLSQRTNETMRVLTIFASFILPMSLIAGIYGMNFRFMPELDFKYGYFVVLGLMLAFALILAAYFRRKGWF